MYKVVIIDDSRTQIDLLRTTFQILSRNTQIDRDFSRIESLELNILKNNVPDIILLDMNFGAKNERKGLEYLKILKDKDNLPNVPIIILSGDKPDGATLRNAFRIGANGYISKSSTPAIIVEYTEDIIKENVTRITQDLVPILIRIDPNISNEYGLTRRELEVIRNLANDNTPEEIAINLGITRPVIYEHMSNTRAKMEVITNWGLVAKAIREQIIE